ncbi:virulence RhuM family protein [Candidatus Pacearchaeota archaeon]|nr:virulence RhuM family protein [Candidatus Pacearchaeota archaeon]
MDKINNIQKSKFLLYKADDEEISVEVFFRDENIWLSQKLMGNLFGVDRSVITKHLNNIFLRGELNENSVCAKFAHAANDKKIYSIKYYNLDAIISVGYRVNSQKATKFRIWATSKLREYILKGFVLDDERLKNGEYFGKNYFDELVDRIRDIRTSERNFYQKITDIYATSVDYNKNAPETVMFFSVVQNKMHFGIHGKTASEIIYERVDSEKDNLGILCISSDKIKRKDVFIAKNYLNEEELKELNLIVDMYLSFAELQAKNKRYMRTKDWIRKLDDFLKLNEKEILDNSGKISRELANQKVSKEYDIFSQKRFKDYESDFDIKTKRILDKIGGKNE